MGELVEGDDHLPAEVVGKWVKDKHDLLCRYIDITRAARSKYLPPDNTGGAAYIDLFCGPGRCFIEETGEWADGSAVAAWKQSITSKTPFTRVIVGDADPERLAACVTRLKALGAPVLEINGKAKDTSFRARQGAPVYGLNFAFLDPYNLQTLDFSVIETLAKIPRIDIMVHVSAMDLQRNLDTHLNNEESAFDAFAPGWRNVVKLGSQARTRESVFSHWRNIVGQTGAYTSDDVRLITGSKNQRLYWLLLAAKHELAHKFWSIISKKTDQGSLDL
ncbi:MAG: three-Cys-motif partner protein TcmP [Mesorhizobium sp.]|nr:MAG: three-Cys-motif partner protein TcmP [Mesorhizobium sp.]